MIARKTDESLRTVRLWSLSAVLCRIQKKVLVIGAGASGLAAARQLHNFGMQVSQRPNKS